MNFLSAYLLGILVRKNLPLIILAVLRKGRRFLLYKACLAIINFIVAVFKNQLNLILRFYIVTIIYKYAVLVCA